MPSGAVVDSGYGDACPRDAPPSELLGVIRGLDRGGVGYLVPGGKLMAIENLLQTHGRLDGAILPRVLRETTRVEAVSLQASTKLSSVARGLDVSAAVSPVADWAAAWPGASRAQSVMASKK